MPDSGVFIAVFHLLIAWQVSVDIWTNQNRFRLSCLLCLHHRSQRQVFKHIIQFRPCLLWFEFNSISENISTIWLLHCVLSNQHTIQIFDVQHKPVKTFVSGLSQSAIPPYPYPLSKKGLIIILRLTIFHTIIHMSVCTSCFCKSMWNVTLQQPAVVLKA